MAENYQQALMRRLQMIQDLGSNATNLALQRTQHQDYTAGMPTQLNAPTGGGGKDFKSFLNSIAKQESGGNYRAQNSSSGAMGKYQIMPSNIMGLHKGWDYEALGRDVNIGEFLGSPQIQEAVAQYKLKSYYDKYGPAGAAVAWYAGPGNVSSYLKNPGKFTNPQGAYPSIAAYASQVTGRM